MGAAVWTAAKYLAVLALVAVATYAAASVAVSLFTHPIGAPR